MATAEQYQAKVSAYFFATLGRPASSAELAGYTQVLADNNGSVWKPAGASLVSYLTPLLEAATAGQSNGKIVTDMFVRLVGSQPPLSLFNYYTSMLDQGTIKLKGLANAMLNDLTLMPNVDGEFSQPSNWTIDLSGQLLPGQRDAMIAKTGVAVAFTAALDTPEENNAFMNDPSLAVQLLADVTDEASAEAAKGQIDQVIEDIVSGGGNPGENFVLTPNVDEFTLANGKATAGDDTYVAVQDNAGAAPFPATHTYNNGDVIDGAGGRDTLDLTIAGYNPVATTLKNIEVVQVRSAVGNAVFDLDNTDGKVDTLINRGSSANLAFNNIDSATTKLTVQNATAAGLQTTFNYNAGKLAGADDAADLTLNNLGTGAAAGNNKHTISLAGGAATEGFETVNINTTGAASNLAALNVTGLGGGTNTLRTLNVTGNQNLNLDTLTFANGVAATLNASEFTGGLTVRAFSANNVDVTGGKGNDTFLFGGTLDAGDKVDGGDGFDTLGANTFAILRGAFEAGRVSNIEAIRIEQAIATANETLDVSKAGNVSSVSINGIGANANQINKLADNGTVTLTAAGTGNLTVNVTDATLAGTNNTLNVNLGTATDAATFAAGTLTVPGVETINVASLGTVATAGIPASTNTLTITGNAALQTLNVTGSEDVTLTFQGGGAALRTFNAGQATGVQNTGAIDFSGSGAAITGGSRNDVLHGGAGNDTIVGGDGNDILWGRNGSDVLTGGNGSDTFQLSTNNNGVNATNTIVDTITDMTLGAGNDVLDLSRIDNAWRPVVNGNVSAVTINALNAALPSAGTDGRAELIILDSSVAEMRAADAQALNNKLFALNGIGGYGNVIVAYAATDGGNVRLALAEISGGGDIINIRDMAVLQNHTTASLSAGFHQSNLTGMGVAGATLTANAQPFDTLTGAGIAGNTTTGAGNDTINATTLQANDNATVINGQGGANTLNITNDANGLNLADQTTPVANISTINLQGGATGAGAIMPNLSNLTVTASGAAVAIVDLGTGANVNYTGNTGQKDTVTLRHASQIATIGDNGDDINAASTAGTVQFTNAGTVTVNSLLHIGGLLTFTGSAGADTLTIADGATGAVTLANINGIETLNVGSVGAGTLNVNLGTVNSLTTLTGTSAGGPNNITYTATGAQAQNLLAVGSTAAAGTTTLALSTGGAINLTGKTFANLDLITLSSASQLAVTSINSGGTALLGVTGSAGADTLTLSTSSTIANVTAVETIQFNATTAAQTLTTGAYNFGAATATNITAAGATQGVTIDASGIITITAGHTVLITDSAQNDTIIVSTTDGARALQTVTLTGGNDVVRIVNDAHNGTVNSAVTINGFTAGAGATADQLDLRHNVATVFDSSAADFVTITAADTNGSVARKIVEFSVAGQQAANLSDVSDGGAVEAVIAGGLGNTGVNLVAADAGNRTFFAVVYGTGADANKAGIYTVQYEAADLSATNVGTGNITVELIGLVNNVAADSFVASNFV